MMKLRDTFFYEPWSIWESLHLKNLKRSAIMDHILLGLNATYDDFSILIPENNQFRLHFKESLLIKRDKLELNRNIYTHPLELSA